MLKKKFLKTKCKVEFVLPVETLGDVESVHVVGDFNEWSEDATPMEKKGKNYKVTVDMKLDSEYQFRYLINGAEWRNDLEADGVVSNPHGSENSLVKTVAE